MCQRVKASEGMALMQALTVADVVVLREGEGAGLVLNAALGWPLEEATRGLLLEVVDVDRDAVSWLEVDEVDRDGNPVEG